VTFDLGVLWEYRVFLLRGAAKTLLLALLAQSLALALAVPLALARLGGRGWTRRLAGGYVEFVRGTPALVQLFWVFYCIPLFTGFDWSPLTGAVVALGLNVAAYDAEAFRAGIQSVHHGQVQAARALGLSRWGAFAEVVLPQATRFVLPALLNNFIGLLLFTSIASTIGVDELTYAGGKINTATFQSVVVFTGVGALYLAMSAGASHGIRRLERARIRREQGA
jgi:His/Glu/Gln/Arg/opine family amino acid ABC transporter permease subunit